MNQDIPLFSFRALSQPNVTAAIQRVVDSQWYVMGAEVAAFEREFAAYCGVLNCVSVANGTDALELGLRALGVKPGDRVLAVANAGFYGSTAIHLLGATPDYIDIDPKTLTISVEHLREAIGVNVPQAIIVTHLYGQLADIETIVELAAKAGIPVIEDCAQAHGAMRSGKRAGSFGSIGCFSFYPTKNLGAMGDGGAVVTSDASLAAHLRQLRQYGWAAKYRVEMAGGRNSRLDEMQAAILREKLPCLERWNAERREIARRYNSVFARLPLLCPPSLGADYVAHLYVVRVAKRETFRAFLKEHGVATDVHYPVPDHLQAANAGSQPGYSLSATEAACDAVVSLPCFPGLTDQEVERVIQAVVLYFQQRRVG